MKLNVDSTNYRVQFSEQQQKNLMKIFLFTFFRVTITTVANDSILPLNTKLPWKMTLHLRKKGRKSLCVVENCNYTNKRCMINMMRINNVDCCVFLSLKNLQKLLNNNNNFTAAM